MDSYTQQVEHETYRDIHLHTYPFKQLQQKVSLQKKKKKTSSHFLEEKKYPKDPGDKRPFSTMDSTGNFKTPHSEEMMILFSLVTCSEMSHPSTDEPRLKKKQTADSPENGCPLEFWRFRTWKPHHFHVVCC